MPRPLFWIATIFATFGLATGAGAIWAYTSSQRYIDEGIATRGVVIDLDYVTDSDGDGSYRPVVEFRDRDGVSRIYHSNSGSNPPSFRRGEEVTIYYLPHEPERALVDSFTERYLVPLILGLFALAFGGVGFGILIAHFLRRREVIDLRTNGVPIQAKFLECFRDMSTSTNGRHPWRVACQATHPASGKLHRFESDAVWVDLTDVLAGKPITVLIDPADADSHYIDLSAFVDEDDIG